jgi:hypothetical protein
MITKSKSVYQFNITLKDIEPAIWRRILVPANYTFWDLHVAIQDAMGWLDYHLHLFRIIDPDSGELEEIGIPDDEPFEDDLDCVPGWERSMAHYFRNAGDHADYEYDFGDGWEHEVVFEGIFPREARTKYPRCIDGARACPPEDCGGVHGYQEMLKIIRNRSHKEHKSMMRWLGGKYDPNGFDPNNVRFDNPKKRWRIAFMDEEE